MSVNFMGSAWEVRVDNSLGDSTMGTCDVRNRRIVINKECFDVDTIMHELIEGAMIERGHAYQGKHDSLFVMDHQAMHNVVQDCSETFLTILSQLKYEKKKKRRETKNEDTKRY